MVGPLVTFGPLCRGVNSGFSANHPISEMNGGDLKDEVEDIWKGGWGKARWPLISC